MSRDSSTSDRIFKIMENMGISQVELSKRTGIPTSTISDWKRKGNTPTAEKISLICKALQINSDEILGTAHVDFSSSDQRVVNKGEPLWELVEMYDKLDDSAKERMLKYFIALAKVDK